MKKAFKFGCLGLIGLFVLMVVIAIIAGGGDTTVTPNNDTTDNASQPEETKEDVVETITVGIGQPLQVGDVVFTVSAVGEEVNIGNQYYSEKPTDGAVFKMVYMNIQNNGSEALTIDSSFFKLLADGSEYSPTTSTVLIDEMFFLEQVNPNLSKKGTLIFEIPSTTSEAQLHVQTGFWGTETGIIDLK